MLNARQKRGNKTVRNKKVNNCSGKINVMCERYVSYLCSFSKPANDYVLSNETIIHEYEGVRIYRVSNGWMWRCINRYACVYRRQGLITFRIYRNIMKRAYDGDRLTPLIRRDEYNKWIEIRRRQTFICVLKRKGYYRYHVPIDIVKIIWNFRV